jgi:hypothetical protein
MDADKRNLIDNEVLRLRIKHHPNYPTWHDSLPLHSRLVFDALLDEDATPELIELAQQSPDEEWDNVQFLRMLGGGNPDPKVALALTNVALSDIIYHIENLDLPEG